MQREIADCRKRWADAHNRRKTSLANVFLAFGISIEESVKWREELYSPADYLSPNPALRETLKRFKDLGLKLALVTNNPALVARKTLALLYALRITAALGRGVAGPARLSAWRIIFARMLATS
ncbi:MAG: HAD family hydrolase [Treponema sp.]|jgi:phosphoglycolate phosphatase/putative hydrolase of the HAD superfamily|nr:HAD family hydrolase [Treponema sp.]